MNEPLGPCRILRCGGIELPEETQSHARKTRPPPPCYQPTALLFVTFFFFFFFPFSTKPPNSTRSLASPSKLTTLYPRRVCILANMLLSFISLFSLSPSPSLSLVLHFPWCRVLQSSLQSCDYQAFANLASRVRKVSVAQQSGISQSINRAALPFELVAGCRQSRSACVCCGLRSLTVHTNRTNLAITARRFRHFPRTPVPLPACMSACLPACPLARILALTPRPHAPHASSYIFFRFRKTHTQG